MLLGELLLGALLLSELLLDELLLGKLLYNGLLWSGILLLELLLGFYLMNGLLNSLIQIGMFCLYLLERWGEYLTLWAGPFPGCSGRSRHLEVRDSLGKMPRRLFVLSCDSLTGYLLLIEQVERWVVARLCWGASSHICNPRRKGWSGGSRPLRNAFTQVRCTPFWGSKASLLDRLNSRIRNHIDHSTNDHPAPKSSRLRAMLPNNASLDEHVDLVEKVLIIVDYQLSGGAGKVEADRTSLVGKPLGHDISRGCLISITTELSHYRSPCPGLVTNRSCSKILDCDMAVLSCDIGTKG